MYYSKTHLFIFNAMSSIKGYNWGMNKQLEHTYHHNIIKRHLQAQCHYYVQFSQFLACLLWVLISYHGFWLVNPCPAVPV